MFQHVSASFSIFTTRGKPENYSSIVCSFSLRHCRRIICPTQKCEPYNIRKSSKSQIIFLPEMKRSSEGFGVSGNCLQTVKDLCFRESWSELLVDSTQMLRVCLKEHLCDKSKPTRPWNSRIKFDM